MNGEFVGTYHFERLYMNNPRAVKAQLPRFIDLVGDQNEILVFSYSWHIPLGVFKLWRREIYARVTRVLRDVENLKVLQAITEEQASLRSVWGSENLTHDTNY